MSQTITYALVVTVSGVREDELIAKGKGAGEARTHFEKVITELKCSASDTTIETTSLTEV